MIAINSIDVDRLLRARYHEQFEGVFAGGPSTSVSIFATSVDASL